MKVVAALLLLAGAVALAGPEPKESKDAGKAAFGEVVKVLQSPRCQNCHPVGDRPLQGDAGKAHAQNISRLSVMAGMPCSTCHQDHNTDGPPGAPKWGLPPAETPMVFQGMTPTNLCEQLKDPARNGHRSLAQLLDHVANDPLVGWGWAPGGKRTQPPLPRDKFVAAFKTWVDSNGACP